MEKFRRVKLLGEGGVKGYCMVPTDPESGNATKETYREFALLPEQTHSLNVGIAESTEDRFEDTDALITFQAGLPIGVVTADCVPILIYARDISAVAAIHAGWRGTLGGIVEKTIDELERYGASPAMMTVAFGPSISQACYEVDEELADRFRKAGFAAYISYPDSSKENEGYIKETQPVPTDSRVAKPHIDLQGINIYRLTARGVLPHNIRPNPDCTYSTLSSDGRPLYSSHRRSSGSPARNLTLISLPD